MVKISDKTLQDLYQQDVVPALKKEFGYKNDLAVPRLNKIVVNTGFGRLAEQIKSSDQQEKMRQAIEHDLILITGQKPTLRRARKSVAGFHLREGDPIGYTVTLRRNYMYDFLDRVIKLALPRTRDFRGISLKSMDGRGNLTLGFPDQTVFPEISSEEERMLFGLEAVINTTAKTDQEAIQLLTHLGLPFRPEETEE
ncbi:MAG TPA: 50S ribosomal protein L5 [Candidatus Pacearchaeota archaeon]|nr:50S ribosomal protein L5 [Candidatus Pacearchaeota archaeon]